MKPNITNLAKYLGNSRNKFYEMQKNQPKQFELIMNGFKLYCENTKQER